MAISNTWVIVFPAAVCRRHICAFMDHRLHLLVACELNVASTLYLAPTPSGITMANTVGVNVHIKWPSYESLSFQVSFAGKLSYMHSLMASQVKTRHRDTG